jgi:hypothetical protein
MRIGAHVASNTANGPFDLYRVGGKVMLPLSARVYVQGTLNRFFSEGEWEASGSVRYRPFGPAAGDSPFYIGAGWEAMNFGPNNESNDLWLAGLEIPTGRLRPCVEIQVLGPIKNLMTQGLVVAVQAYSGITWSVR